jgi:hypothetical protein
LERLHVEPITGENAAMISPARIGGGAPPAGIGAIDYVIVNQRGAVEKLDDGRQANGAGAALSCCVSVAQEQEGGPEAFPSAAKKIRGDLGNWLEGNGALAGEFLFDENEVVANEIKNLLSREQRDGLPPGLKKQMQNCDAVLLRLRGRRQRRPGKTKEAAEIRGGGGGHFFRR